MLETFVPTRLSKQDPEAVEEVPLDMSWGTTTTAYAFDASEENTAEL